jgi:predicted O-methyltransferase YrrM
MSIESVNPPEIERYVREQTLRESEAQLTLRRETAALPDARMLLAPEVGGLLALLVRMIGARRVLELGTFTGYSALAMALALPEGGRILACDVSEEWTAIARRHWKAAGVADRIELRLAPAAETLAALKRDGRGSTFDLAFVDADKASYPDYYEACHEPAAGRRGRLRQHALERRRRRRVGERRRHRRHPDAQPAHPRRSARRRLSVVDRRRSHGRPQTVTAACRRR